MTYFYACVGCIAEKTSCAPRSDMKAAINGLGVTSIKHKCSHRVARFQPGGAVFVRTIASKDCSPNYYDDDGPTVGIFPGVFIRQDTTKGLAFIKPGEIDSGGSGLPFEPSANGYVKISLSRMTIRNAPAVIIKWCDFCGGIPALTGRCGNTDPYGASKCLYRKMQQAEAAQ